MFLKHHISTLQVEKIYSVMQDSSKCQENSFDFTEILYVVLYFQVRPMKHLFFRTSLILFIRANILQDVKSPRYKQQMLFVVYFPKNLNETDKALRGMQTKFTQFYVVPLHEV